MQSYLNNWVVCLFFPLNHGYVLFMWTYLLYFNLLSIAIIDSIGCWKKTQHDSQRALRMTYSYCRDFAQLPHSVAVPFFQ